MKYVGFWTRGVACIIDGVLTSIVGWICFFILFGILSWTQIFSIGSISQLSMGKVFSSFQAQVIEGAFEFVFYLFYYTYFQYKFGKTLGKKLLGIKVVSEDTGDLMTLKQSALRTISTFFSMIILGVGYLMAAYHPRKKSLHDLIAKTVVIKDS